MTKGGTHRKERKKGSGTQNPSSTGRTWQGSGPLGLYTQQPSWFLSKICTSARRWGHRTQDVGWLSSVGGLTHPLHMLWTLWINEHQGMSIMVSAHLTSIVPVQVNKSLNNIYAWFFMIGARCVWIELFQSCQNRRLFWAQLIWKETPWNLNNSQHCTV